MKSDPGKAVWQRDRAVTLSKVGEVRLAQGDLPGALESFRASHDIWDRLTKFDPRNGGWRRDLALSHERIGDVLVAQGDLQGALKNFRDSLAIKDRLANADLDNAVWQRELCIDNERLGDLYLKQGNTEEARQAFERALAACEVLIARRPGDVQPRVLSVAPRLRLAELDPLRAREHVAGALAILKPSTEADRPGASLVDPAAPKN